MVINPSKCFMAYQPFPCYLMQNSVALLNNKEVDRQENVDRQDSKMYTWVWLRQD